MSNRSIGATLYTAGYQGETAESFLTKIRSVGVKLLLDVRENPISRKSGFSKTALKDLCEANGIAYAHLPALGVPSQFRKSLRTAEDYFRVLDQYERKLLPQASEARNQAARLVRKERTVLLCFERDVHCCHRGRLARVLSAETGIPVVHL